jgi:hypothetical protein
MKKTEKTTPEMKSEYDFTGRKGERGKYTKAYREGHTVQIHEPNGTVTIQYFGLEDGAVMLEPDVRAYFSNSESVNAALRSLIELMKHLPPGEYDQKKKPARQVAE